MVVISSKEGQFANRVLHTAHVLSFCKSHNVRLVHPFFKEYLDYFPRLKSERLVLFTHRFRVINFFSKLFLLLVRVLLKLKIYNLGFLEILFYERYEQGAPVFNLSDHQVIRKAKRKILVLYGWLFRAENDFSIQESYIRKVFLVRESENNVAENLIDEIRHEYSVLVGVHVRRGDYKWFENGRWYYEDEVYEEKMMYLKNDLHKKVGFIICSNEEVKIKLGEEIGVFQFKKSFIIDFLLLAKSDYIIGPPSTFSTFASFYGNVPIQFIDTKDKCLTLPSFRVAPFI